MKRKLMGLLLSAAFIAISVLSAACDGRERVVVYNWGEYIDEDTVARFEEAYPQIKVIYRTFDDNEKMYPRIGRDSFDVIIPSDYMVVRLIKEGKLQKINPANIPNVGLYLSDDLKSIVFDPDEAVSNMVYDYAVPYMYCTVGLIYNTSEIAFEDPTDPQEVWGVLFDETYKNRIGMYDSMRESIGTALNYLGYSVNSIDSSELEAAKELLIRQRQQVSPIIGIDTLKDKYISGELVAGVAWSGDYQVCVDALEEAGEDPEILQFALPKGSNFAVDLMCIPANAKNVRGAELFINFMYDTQIALANTLYAGYSTPHKEAYELLPDNLRSNRMFYPDQEAFDTLEIYYSSEWIDSAYDSIWAQVLAH